MTRRVETLIIIALSLLLLSFHVRLKRQADPQQINEIANEAAVPRMWKGKAAPDFTLTLTDGSGFTLADHAGKEVIILNFFATWCAPCRAETPELNRFVQSARGKPVTFIGIDAAESPETVAAYMRELKIVFPVGIDDGAIARLYGVRSFPTTVVIGADGNVELFETGGIANADVAFGAEVRRELDVIAAQKGVSRETYLARASAETYYDVRPPAADDDSIKLTGRAKELAATWNCVCGCSDTLEKCSCNTATGMKKKLRDTKLDGTNDVAVMEAINAEFCMKGM